jgi:hypothetical protein
LKKEKEKEKRKESRRVGLNPHKISQRKIKA